MSKQKRTIAIDFDGVLHRYSGYKNGYVDGPIKGARESVMRLISQGMTVVVFSTRDKFMIEEWLDTHGFPALEVTNVKRPFWLILDDRAIAFRGEWSGSLVREMLEFKPYWDGERPAAGELS